jgi:hypothetical protein
MFYIGFTRKKELAKLLKKEPKKKWKINDVNAGAFKLWLVKLLKT